MNVAEVNRCRKRLNEDPELQADVLDVYHLGPAAIVVCLRRVGFDFTEAEYAAFTVELDPKEMTPFERLVADIEDADSVLKGAGFSDQA